MLFKEIYNGKHISLLCTVKTAIAVLLYLQIIDKVKELSISYNIELTHILVKFLLRDPLIQRI